MVSPFGPSIEVRDRFGPERQRLLELLDGLDAATWRADTCCPGWAVKDIATHLLGDDLGRLARTRDGSSEVQPRADEDLPSFIDRINDEWVRAARRMSPRLVVDSLRWTGSQIAELWRSLPPDQPSGAVWWAGAEVAPVWFDAARDLTEYWVHRRQISEAVGLPSPQDPDELHTVLDTFLRALPHTLRDQRRPDGATFSFEVTGPGGGLWTVRRTGDAWRWAEPDAEAPDAVTLDAETTWRLCVRMLEPDDARAVATVRGDEQLAAAATTIVSIIHAG